MRGLHACLLALACSQVCAAETIALVGATVYAHPGAPPVPDAVVLIEGDVIRAVGPKGLVVVPPGARIVDCAGDVITAGFWNNHVHFTDPQWENAGSRPAAQLSQQLEAMLTRFGFSTVFDTGSDFANTDALRARIDRGEVSGPRILTAGEPLVKKDGTPFYVRPLLPELLTPAQASDLVRRKIALGADAIKLHSGTITNEQDKDNSHVFIPAELVRAVTAEAHRHGKPILAHPQYEAGLRAAIEGDVDVLVHVTEELTAWPPDLLAEALRKRVALIPTLKMLAGPGPAPKRDRLLAQVREYHERGGAILFGTDVGFIPDYDPTEEYVLMAQAGMRPMQILSSLTTAPVDRFRRVGNPSGAGRIAEGFEADITVLDGDPVVDVRNFARVRYTIRGGTFIFSRH